MRHLLALAAALLVPQAAAQSPIAALGKERAAASALQWEVREAGHSQLGPIVFAFLKAPVVTPAGNAKVFSNAYVSCERSTAKIAIELANGRRIDDPGGLKPRRMPQLTCRSTDGGKPSAEPIAARWTVNETGDTMARGLWPASLRTCASIGVSEELELPAGWGGETARVEFEIPVYAREVDTVFARCGEPTAWPYAAAPSSPPAELPKAAAATTSANGNGWIAARVVTQGHTNVRAQPDVHAPLVTRLDPGDIVLVRRAQGDWWQARSRSKARTAFEGYIRRDRLVFR